MPEVDIDEFKKELTDANKALHSFREGPASKLEQKHVDVLDKIAADDLLETASKAIENYQKLEAKAEAEENKRQALEAKLEKLETVIGRPGSSPEQDEKKLAECRSKIFSEFLRKGVGSVAHDFSDFVDHKSDDWFKGQGIEKKDLSVGVDPSGGYLVTPEFGGIIETRVFETSPIRRVANVVTIGTDALEIIADNDEAAQGWVSETASRTATNTPTLDKITIPTHEQYAMPEATQKLLDDAGVNVEQWLSGKVSDKLARTENTAFVTGNGVGKPRGFTIPVQSAASATYSATEVEFVPSTSAGAFTADGIIDLQFALKEAYQGNATFITKRANLKSIMKLKQGTGEYLFNRNLDAKLGTTFDLLGKPVLLADDIAAVGANALALAYGDFRAGYTIVDRMGIRVLRDPYSNKPLIQFYTTKRVGGDVVNFEAIKLQKLSAS